MRHAVGVLLFLVCATSARGQDGAGLYSQHCGTCHDLGLPRTPTRRVLSAMEPERILAALETGTMRVQGAQRTVEERRAIAAFLTGKAVGDTPAPPAPKMCASKPSATSGTQWNGWGVTLANDRYQRDAAAKLSADIPRLKVKWAFGFAGDASSAVQPSVVGGRVLVASVTGRCSAGLEGRLPVLDVRRGRTVRTAMAIGDVGGVQTAFFGDVYGNVTA